MERMAEGFQRAERKLREGASFLDQAVGGDLDTGDRVRFRNTFLNGADLAGSARELIGNKILEDQAGAGTLLGGLQRGARTPTQLSIPGGGAGGAGGGGGLASSAATAQDLLNEVPELGDLFGKKAGLQNPTSEDALAQRMALLNGLSDQKRAAALAELQLAEKRKLKLKNGKEKTIDILHNGYIFGGGATSLDCSSFIGSLLPTEARKGRFTTWDLFSMYIYLRVKELPDPPKWEKKKSQWVKDMAKSFMPVNIYKHDKLMPGDLLVFRVFGINWGHVFLVKHFNPKTVDVTVIEAAQSAGTVRERVFPLSVDPYDAPVRYYRPGMFGLRLKSSQNTACRYDAARRGGASVPTLPGAPGGSQPQQKRSNRL
jgi:hypothetical protein